MIRTLDEKQEVKLMFEVIKLLKGMSVLDADNLLKQTRGLLKQGIEVNLNTPFFEEMFSKDFSKAAELLPELLSDDYGLK